MPESTMTTTDQVLDGQRIVAAREAKGWTQGQLAAAVNTAEARMPGDTKPINDQIVSKWERGAMGVSLRRLAALADALDVSTDYLLGRAALPTGRPVAGEEDAPIPELAAMFPPGSEPTPDELAWLRNHAEFHRVDARGLHQAIMGMRYGMTAAQAEASRLATVHHLDPNVPRKKR